jgi:probable rRNA maturation factor
VHIAVKNYQESIPIDQALVRRIVFAVISKETPKNADITVCFITDEVMKDLNSRYHSSDEPTDVLSFNLSGPGKKFLKGDIAISADTALVNASLYKTSPRYELCLYVVHGLLHLCGYDDEGEEDAKVMRRKELKYLDQCAVGRRPKVEEDHVNT